MEVGLLNLQQGHEPRSSASVETFRLEPTSSLVLHSGVIMDGKD